MGPDDFIIPGTHVKTVLKLYGNCQGLPGWHDKKSPAAHATGLLARMMIRFQDQWTTRIGISIPVMTLRAIVPMNEILYPDEPKAPMIARSYLFL